MSDNKTVIKKAPERKCIGCQGRFPKSSLVRVLRTPEGETVLDLTGKRSGRGAYICKNASCLKKARKGKRLEAALQCAVADDIYNKMEEELTLG